MPACAWGFGGGVSHGLNGHAAGLTQSTHELQKAGRYRQTLPGRVRRVPSVVLAGGRTDAESRP